MVPCATVIWILFASVSAQEWTIGREVPWPAPNVLPSPDRVLTLNGQWHFVTDPVSTLTPEKLRQTTDARTIRVPCCWEAAFEDLVDYDGVAWYWRAFDVPEQLLKADRLFLRFDAADYLARVWLNGVELGQHEGGYSPFEFEVTGRLRPAGNELVVRVVDPATDPRKSDGIALAAVPNGKQQHYCNIGGLWQSVSLVGRSQSFIHSLFVASETLSRIRVRACIDGTAEGLTLRVRALSPDGRGLGEAKAPAARIVDVVMDLRDPPTWAPDNPSLCILQAELLRGAQPVYRTQVRFGVRTIEARDRKFLLNGVPMFLAGALDQDFYPRAIYAPDSDAMLHRQFQVAKSAGLNFLRTHIKIPTPGYRGLGFEVPESGARLTPGYLDAADEQGILVWDDFPSWYQWSEEVRRRVERQMYEWVWRDFNRPSIFCWCLINEEWGMNFHDPAVRAWIKDMWHRVKSWDPWRLVVDNSPASGGHIISDFFDQHVYMAIPERARDWQRWLDEFCKRPRSYFPYPESEERGFEPLVVSEFGNWGLPDVTKILEFYGGQDPYWFNQHSYGGPIRGGLDAFQACGLRAAYGSLSALAEATQRHQLDSLKYEIEQMRVRPDIVGYVITQFTDLNSESNGLMDMIRNPKLAASDLSAVQGQTVVVANLLRRAYRPGEQVEIPIVVSHFGPEELPALDPELQWALNGKPLGRKALGNQTKTDVTLTTPEVDRPAVARLEIELRVSGGRVLARNYTDLWLIPETASRPSHVRQVWANGQTLAGALRECGVEVDPGAPLHVLSRLSEAEIEFVAAGGRALLIAGDTSALGPLVSSLQIAHRTEKGRIGDWATAFCWLRRTPAFSLHLPYDGHLGMHFVDCVPMHVVDGLTPEQIADAWGGVFVAWMHDPAATILPVKLGRGVLVIATFPPPQAVADLRDPVATALLADLLDAAARVRPDELRAPALEYLASNVLIPTARQAKVVWRYTTEAPPRGWQRSEFDDGRWQEGVAGFGRPGTPGAEIGTEWTTSDIWLRKKVYCDRPAAAVVVSVHHDEDAELYINGVPMASWKGYTVDYRSERLNPRLVGVLRPGENVVAVHCRQTVGGQYIDLGLSYAPGGAPPCPLAGGRIVISSALEGGDVWTYTTEHPVANWQSADFDDRTWACGLSPFGAGPVPNAEPATAWQTPEIWLRKVVVLDAPPTEGLLRIYHDEDAEVYVNGKQVFTGAGFLTSHRQVELTPEQLSAFQPGRNIVAIHCRQTGGGQLIDLGLYLK
ncbi:MAG: hypothetical protein H5T86_03165 [Armatimonadetes bacterium]|nr:hypothetical protein [Armatimonadota bacterium]